MSCRTRLDNVSRGSLNCVPMSEPIVPARQSASVVIVRDGADSLEVLMLRRNQKIAFHGGDWVFPGGRVDEADAQTDGDGDGELDVARRAAAREAFEEAGLDVVAHEMVPFAHWTTPEGLPKRFATWFFVAEVAADTVVQIDGGEIVDHQWLSPKAALEQRKAGQLSLPAPTYVTLLGFSKMTTCQALIAYLRAGGVEQFLPRLVKFEGGRSTLYKEDAGYETLELDAPGARHRLVISGTDYDYVRDF
jgi:8-oxo-dGTP pyrophosphatase MutT (NUDIX family)